MTKLTSHRSSKKAAEENEAITSSSVSDIDTKSVLSSSENPKGNSSDHGMGVVRPSSTWGATATSTTSASHEQWSTSGHSDDSKTTGRGRATIDHFCEMCCSKFVSLFSQ